MGSSLKYFLLRLGWKLPYIRFLSSARTVILLYHGVPKETDGGSINATIFEEHITFLKQHFEIVFPNRLWERRKTHHKIRVMLTFDDGFRNHADVVAPILKEHHVPALFFLCSRHSTPGKYLWFSYLRALQSHFPRDGFYFRGEFIDMSPDQRDSNIKRLSDFLVDLKPHPAAMYEAMEKELPPLEDFASPEKLADCYAGMTTQQVKELAADSLFSFGVHTVDHPFLTKCQPDEMSRQILDNKTWIEAITNLRCDSIAYPSGDYNHEIVRQCRRFGLTHGHALIPMLKTEIEYELPRIGIYSASLDVLGFKVQWGNLLRAIRVKVG